MDAPRKFATYEDLLALPASERAEIIGGSLLMLPSSRPRHSNVQRALGRFVGGPFHDDDGFGGPGGWWIFLDVDVALGLPRILEDFELRDGLWVNIASYDEHATAQIPPFEAVELPMPRIFLPRPPSSEGA
ncbi:hypothetical protein [Polyangium mundeleinium]|uniref:Restriction endonuclease domain-containing protein n=1 Tax=Polyangium mundeleinium TaxID=2995306 RepID=A0ABT5EUL7_9BACT|nr:hypothetical protein [Polyangium mundeleinium]MDC0745515.1 hypothetical protein [Polyangium mundeleinium]